MTYKPNPIDISDIELSPELHELTELLSENAHENWAAARIRNGWSYGRKRDDRKKETPCLVPYSRLSDSEKEYDRILVINLLKVIKKLGFRIEKVNGNGS